MIEWFGEVPPDEIRHRLKQIYKKLVETSKQFATEHTDVLSRLWDEYDVNGDGALSLDELVRFRRHSLQFDEEQIRAQGDQMAAMYEQGVKIELMREGLYSQAATNSSKYDSRGQEILETQLAEHKKALATATQEQIDQIIEMGGDDQLAKAAQECLKQLDANGDGTVSKADFLEMFLPLSVSAVVTSLCAELGIDVDEVDLDGPAPETGGPLLVRSNSFSEHMWTPLAQAKFDFFLKIGELFTQTLSGLQQPADEESVLPKLEVFGRQVLEQARQFGSQHVELTQKLWEKYDEDGDGQLSIQELEKLCVHAIRAMCMDMQVRATKDVEDQVEAAKAALTQQGLFDQPSQDSEFSSLGEEILQERILVERGAALLQIKAAMVVKTENATQIAKEQADDVFKCLDADKDGVVSREDFNKSFLENYILKDGLKEVFTNLGLPPELLDVQPQEPDEEET
eukprot:TRINITY_DN29846_c0_g1_i1.p1 TRINITY_DN29846_c0_g1~~TRINITY_DN29846_c0_g1_i1.p1  ORF type:complete len:456 (-),score=137.29 TRINITY_DN29846_c0_g1_i1:214-1581(-)